MAIRNIDFGSFPDDPSADAIRTAFEKTQENFTELFSGLQEQAVLSINRTPGDGITTNSPVGNVVISANIAQVRIQSSTLDLSTGSNASPASLAVINSGTVPIFINIPQNVTGIANITLADTLSANTVNVSSQLNGNTANFTGNISTSNVVISNSLVSNSLTINSVANLASLNVTGNANVSSNVNAVNIIASGNLSGSTANVSGNVNANIVNANYFYGDGSNLTNVLALANTRILNGTSYANISDVNGNLNIVIAGNPAMTVTATGAIVTGNLAAGNLMGPLANGNSNVSLPAANGNVSIYTAGSIRANFTTTGANITGTLNATGNANVANLGTGRVIATGNISATQFISNIATGTAPLAVTSNTVVANLNADLLDGYNTATTATANTVAVRDANGSLTANTFIGSGATLTNIPGANVSGTVAAATTAGTVTTNAQPNITSVGTLSSLAITGNVTAGNANVTGQLISTVTTGTAPLSVSSTTQVPNLHAQYANISNFSAVTQRTTGIFYPIFVNGSATSNRSLSANANLSFNVDTGALTAISFIGDLTGTASTAITAGTVTASSQPNITSVGTLTSLGVNGNITAANITANTGVFTGNANGLTNIPGANVTGIVANATYAANAGYSANAGNATTASSATTAGTVTTASQPNITSVGTLSSLAISGNLTSGNANLGNSVTANYFLGDGGLLSNITVSAGSFIINGTSNVTVNNNSNVNITVAGTANVVTVTSTGANINGYANITGNLVAGNISATNISGNITTSEQPNITSVGTLTGLTVNGVSNLGPNSNVKITGGVNNAFLRTDGAGNLIWDTATLVPAQGTNSQVIFNDGGSTYAGNANLTFNKTTGALTVGGNLSAGNINGANNITANFFTGTLRTNAQPNITSVGTLTSLIVSGNINSGNISGGNLVTANFIAGTLTTASQPNITSVGTLTGLSVNGNITAANITANTGVFTGNGSGLSAITGANVTGIVANATYANSAGSATTAGTVTTNAQPNITSVGTLTGLIVNGNINSGNISGGNLVTANFVAGTLTTAAQPNITSVGALTSLAVTGNLSAGNISTSNYISAGSINPVGNGKVSVTSNVDPGTTPSALFVKLEGSSGGTATAQYGIRVDANQTYNNSTAVYGVYSTAKQNTGKTSIGVYGQTGVLGSYVPGYGLYGQADFNSGAVHNYANGGLPVGVYGTTLNSTGTGNVATSAAGYFYNQSTSAATAYGVIIKTTSGPTNVIPLKIDNDTTELMRVTSAGNVGISNTNPAHTLSVTGTMNVSGNANVGNIGATNGVFTNVSGNGSGLSSIIGASVVGNVASAVTAGTVTTNSQPNITSVGTLTSLTVTGNANVGNIGTVRVIATGNISGTQLISNIATGTAPLVVTSTTRVSNLNVANAGYADAADAVRTVTSTNTTVYLLGTAAASNINAPGEKTTGIYANMSNNAITATTFVGSLSGAATTAGTVTSNSQPNITSVGTLTSLNVTSNANVGNIGTSQVVATGNISAQSNINVSGYVLRSSTTNISANGATQTTATAISTDINLVNTVSSGQGVRLPVAIAGMAITIINTSANSLLVYPHTGGDINGAAANAAFTQPAGSTLQFVTTNTTDWYTVGATYA